MSNYKVGDLASLFPSPSAAGSGKTLQSLFNQHHKKNITGKTIKELNKTSSDIQVRAQKIPNKKNGAFVNRPQSLRKPKFQKFEKSTDFIRTKKKKENRQFKFPDVSNNIEASLESGNDESSKDFNNADKQSSEPKNKILRTKKKKQNRPFKVQDESDNLEASFESETEESSKECKNVDKQSIKPKKKRSSQVNKESENLFNENSPESENLFNENSPGHSENEENVKKNSEKKFKKSYDEEEYLPFTLFVGNLPMSVTRKRLSKLFRSYGKLMNCRIRGAVAADGKTPKKAAAIQKKLHEGMKSQIGYVVFCDRESATKALSLNGTMVDNHHIIVNFAARSGEKKLYNDDQSVFVGNLPYDVDEETIWTAFQNHGDVQAVRIIRDRVTGLGKGFGYVQFKDSVSKNNVLNMNELVINKRKIRIKSIVTEASRKQGAKDAIKQIRFNLALNKAKLYGTKKSVKKLLKKERIIHQKKQIASKLGQKFVK